MSDAAHPQPDVATDPGGEPDRLLAANPFPSQVRVPGLDGEPVVVDLSVVDGVVYAPGLDDYPLTAPMRQYVTQFCATWSQSVLTTARVEQQAQERPRRGQLIFEEMQFHAMLGLAADERLLRIDVEQVTGRVRFVVESPRLPQQPYWNGGPPIVTLPIAAYYEDRVTA